MADMFAMAGKGWRANTEHGLDEGGWWDIWGKEDGNQDARWLQHVGKGLVKGRFTPQILMYEVLVLWLTKRWNHGVRNSQLCGQDSMESFA